MAVKWTENMRKMANEAILKKLTIKPTPAQLDARTEYGDDGVARYSDSDGNTFEFNILLHENNAENTENTGTGESAASTNDQKNTENTDTKLHPRAPIFGQRGTGRTNTFLGIPVTKTSIAQVAHDVNRAFCQSIGDSSQPTWEDAPEWQKASALNGVDFHLNNPEADPSQSHENWLKQKEAEGWKYGPVKNPETREHPCYLPYDQLPVEQRSKDYLFKQVVNSLKPFLK